MTHCPGNGDHRETFLDGAGAFHRLVRVPAGVPRRRGPVGAARRLHGLGSFRDLEWLVAEEVAMIADDVRVRIRRLLFAEHATF